MAAIKLLLIVHPPPRPSLQTLPLAKRGLRAGLIIRLKVVSGVGREGKDQETRWVKVIKTFCSFFLSPGAVVIRAQLRRMKILSKLLTQGYALKQITGVDEKQNAWKDMRQNLGKYSHFFNTLSYYQYCGLDACNCSLSMLCAVHLVSGAFILSWLGNLSSFLGWKTWQKNFCITEYNR